MLTIASHHPDIVPGHAQEAAYALFGAMRGVAELDPLFLAGVQHYLTPQIVKPEGAIWGHAGRADELLLAVRGYDPFWISNTGQAEPGWQKVIAALAALRPDVVIFGGLAELGVELIRAACVARPAARMFLTLRDLTLPIPAGIAAREPPATAAEAALGFTDRRPAEIALRADLLRTHLAWLEGCVATSEFVRARHAAWGLPAERIALIRPGTPGTPGRRATPAAPSARRNRFGLSGPLSEAGGTIVALAAAKLLLARGLDDFTLVIEAPRGGSPMLRKSVEDTVEATPQLRMVEGGGDAAVDWVILPTLTAESAPPELDRAFADGRPVLASDIGGLPERVQGCGLLFPPGKVTALADRMTECLAGPGLWDRLAAGIPAVPAMADELAAWRALFGSSEPAASPRRPAGSVRAKGAGGR